jgi:NADH-quinone oxidoreductase subunit G
VGCNVTIEHRRGDIKRYKPRFNPEVNDYWMCDYGRSTFERYKQVERLKSPRAKGPEGAFAPLGWKEALDLAHRRLRSRGEGGAVAFLGSGFLTTEEAYLFAALADRVGTPHRSVPVDLGPEWTIPNLKGGIAGREAAPNRRGAELAGLAAGTQEQEEETEGEDGAALGAEELLAGDGATRCAVLVVTDSDFGRAAYDPATVARLRRARFLIVFGWADSPLAKAADLAIPMPIHAEKEGTFVNVEHRLQRFKAAFPSPGQVRPGVEVLADLLARFDPEWAALGTAQVFARLAARVPAFAGLAFERIPATGVELAEERVAG